MNLEELKEIWATHTEEVSEDQYVNYAELQRLLQKRSKGALSKINRNILLELAGLAMLGLGLVYWLSTRKEEVANWEIIGFAAMFMVAIGFYYIKYKSLNRNEIQGENMLESLESLTRNMGFYIRFYLYAVIFLVPSLAFLGGYYGLYIRRLSYGETASFLSKEGWFLFSAAMLLYALIAIFATHWYFKKVYGTHYQELKNCLQELKEL